MLILVFCTTLVWHQTVYCGERNGKFWSGPFATEKECYCTLDKEQNEDLECFSTDFAESYTSTHVYPITSQLVEKNYFHYYKVNLGRKCRFWDNEGRCTQRNCEVDMCAKEELPIDYEEEEDNEKCQNSEMDPLDTYISGTQKENFESWGSFDYEIEQFFDLGEHEPEAGYVDLLINPERYTGYSGPDANRIWSSIYKENCFMTSSNDPWELRPMPGSCHEKLIFFRILSGMHANVNLFLSSIFPTQTFPGHTKWSLNVNEFVKRFRPENTNNKGPEWLRNIFLLQSVLARAIVKAEPIWKSYHFSTGASDEDVKTKDLVLKLVENLKLQPVLFDERTMFTEPSSESNILKEIKKQFLNISRIMDCVGCDKCRLWGKLQIHGIGTALQILFSDVHQRHVPFSHTSVSESLSTQPHLGRSQIVALFNAFNKYTSGIYFLSKMPEEISKSNLRTEL